MQKHILFGILLFVCVHPNSALAGTSSEGNLFLRFGSVQELFFTLKVDANTLLGIHQFPQKKSAQEDADKKILAFQNDLKRVLVVPKNLACHFKSTDVALEHFGSRGEHIKPSLNIVVHGKFRCPQSLKDKQLHLDFTQTYTKIKTLKVHLMHNDKIEDQIAVNAKAQLILHPPNRIALAPPDDSTAQSY